MWIVPWIVTAVFAGLAIYFAVRPRPNPYPEAVERLTVEVEEAGDLRSSAPEDPPEILSLRLALARGWRPLSRSTDDPGEQALRGLFRFVGQAVLPPLNSALTDGEFRPRVENATNALKDLAFFARGDRGEKARTENVSALVQSVTREYSTQSGVPVRYSSPSGALPVSLQAEGFKDALYLLLANAGRFGGGQTIDVVADEMRDVADEERNIADEERDDVRIRVRDRGPGFSREALERGFEPFWSSDSDSLGLGLTHARRVIEDQGGRIRLQNLENGGAEVEIVLRRAR